MTLTLKPLKEIDELMQQIRLICIKKKVKCDVGCSFELKKHRIRFDWTI